MFEELTVAGHGSVLGSFRPVVLLNPGALSRSKTIVANQWPLKCQSVLIIPSVPVSDDEKLEVKVDAGTTKLAGRVETAKRADHCGSYVIHSWRGSMAKRCCQLLHFVMVSDAF